MQYAQSIVRSENPDPSQPTSTELTYEPLPDATAVDVAYVLEKLARPELPLIEL